MYRIFSGEGSGCREKVIGWLVIKIWLFTVTVIAGKAARILIGICCVRFSKALEISRVRLYLFRG